MLCVVICHFHWNHTCAIAWHWELEQAAACSLVFRLNGCEAQAIFTLTTNCVAGMDHQSSLLHPMGHHHSPLLSPLLALFKRKGCAWDAQVGKKERKRNVDPGAKSLPVLGDGWRRQKNTHKVEEKRGLYHIKSPGGSYLSKLLLK